MANTYTSLHYHLIFSTKNREPWIAQAIGQRIWSFIGGSARPSDDCATGGWCRRPHSRFDYGAADYRTVPDCAVAERCIIEMDS